MLDELTQALFLFDNFDAIVGPEQDGKYLGKWSTRWTAIKGLTEFFNKLTEELVDRQELIASPDPFLQQLGQAYLAYEAQLQEKNCIDFAHQQKLFWELLHNSDIAAQIQAGMRYIMVDEYQDTNYVQEQLLLRVAQPQNNLCVVGDEDQSLYRFTNDVKVYETCPRQYQFFREYEFTPSRSAEIFFGSLVHQTIEDIHRWVLDGQAMRLIQAAIPGLFEANFQGLVNAGYRPIDETQRAIAYQQVMNYFKQNQDRMDRIIG